MPDTLPKKDFDAASFVVEKFDEIRDAVGDIEGAKKKALRCRFKWGGLVDQALRGADQSDAMTKQIATAIDRSRTYVRNHARFHREVKNAFSAYTSDIGCIQEYLHQCEEDDRNLSWSAAIEWMRARNRDEEEDPTSEIDQQKRNVERHLGHLEESSNQLAEMYLEHYDRIPDDERKEVEGVLTRAQQAIEDNENVPEEVVNEKEHRVEMEAWRRWVEQKGCVIPGCGVIDDTVVAHHLDRGGHATKGPDTLTVGLCGDHHDELHNDAPSEEAFWEKYDVNPWKIAAEYQAEVLGKLEQIASILNVA